MNHLRSLTRFTSFNSIRCLYKSACNLKASSPAQNLKDSQKTEQKTESVVPQEPVKSKIDLSALPPDEIIEDKTIKLLEKLSLVDTIDSTSIEILEEAIRFAKPLLIVDATRIEPLITVLEDEPLQIREDEVSEGNTRDEILANASVKEEEYFVAPPGNIPIEVEKDLLDDTKVPEKDLLDDTKVPKPAN